LLENKDFFVRKLSLILLVILITWGGYKNIYEGTFFLQKNNQNTLPAIQFIQQDQNKIVAISHQFVAQALEPPVASKKLFFKIEKPEDLLKLSQALVKEKERQFTYICYPNRPCNVPKTNSEKLHFTLNNHNYRLDISNLGVFGKYPVYQIQIRSTEFTQFKL
jgi:hypothetical protein